MDSTEIGLELQSILKRQRLGLISSQDARQELQLLLAALKALEQGVLEKKVERLEAIMEGRQYGN